MIECKKKLLLVLQDINTEFLVPYDPCIKKYVEQAGEKFSVLGPFKKGQLVLVPVKTAEFLLKYHSKYFKKIG